MWHATDPVAPRRAIPSLSRLLAQGLLSAEEAAAALAGAPAPGADRSGWRARCAWALSDTIFVMRQGRRRAGWAIRDALAPLLAARAPRAALEAAAAAADADAMFSPAERRALLHQEVARALAGLPTTGATRGTGQVQPSLRTWT